MMRQFRISSLLIVTTIVAITLRFGVGTQELLIIAMTGSMFFAIWQFSRANQKP